MTVMAQIPKSPQKRRLDELALHRHFLDRAEQVAHAPINKGGSPHPSVKVGAVIVGASGRELATACNRFPEGVDRRRRERYRDGSKSLWINCAEQMALMQALRHRRDLRGATMYVTLEPCAVCAGMIAEMQLRRVCVPVGAMRRYAKLKSKWKDSIDIGLIKLAEAGVDVVTVDTIEKKKS